MFETYRSHPVSEFNEMSVYNALTEMLNKWGIFLKDVCLQKGRTKYLLVRDLCECVYLCVSSFQTD